MMVCIDQLSASKRLILETQTLDIGVEIPEDTKMWQVKNMIHKFANCSLFLVGRTTLFATLAIVPRMNAQIAISINPPVCSYGYYDYSPYGCAPMGFYGPGYFYNGIFLGVGPWASWGYNHGWGDHRFNGGGGGRYVAGRGNGGSFHAENRGPKPSAGRASRSSTSHGTASATRSHASESRPSPGARHTAATRSAPSHGSSHAAANGGSSHSGASHGGGSHGGSSHGSGEHHD